MLYKIGLLFSLASAASAAIHQSCPHPSEFYEINHYSVRTIRIDSPFDFLFLVRRELNRIQKGLPLQPGGAFSRDLFNASFQQVDQAVNTDGVFGTPPAKFVWLMDFVEDCDDSAKTVDLVYRVYSSDPILAAPKIPEDREALAKQPATSAAQMNTRSNWAVKPLLGYDPARHGYGGGELRTTVPGGILSSFDLSGAGSSSSRVFNAQINGGAHPEKPWLKQVDYHLTYDYSQTPTANFELAKGILDFRAIGYSKPLDTNLGRFSFRYGASIEAGNQQDGLPSVRIPADILSSSAYGAIRIYAGLTHATRYSSAIVSYGFARGGAGLDDLSFTKQVGDISFRRRFPGSSHRPLDIEARASAGGISSSKPMLLGDRFFGGNLAATFIPGDSWLIPDGPLVRSIASNRLAGDGFGGNAFYSGNLTVGKVIYRSPLIPAIVNSDSGFGDAIHAAEQTGENFFADDYETTSPEFRAAVLSNAAKLTSGLQAVQQLTKDIDAQGPAAPDLDKLLRQIDGYARRSLNTIGHATKPDANGQVHALEIKTLLNPSTSLVRKLIADLEAVKPLAPASFTARIDEARTALDADLTNLAADLDRIHNGPIGSAARARAKKDMDGPREAIDTLRNEVNIHSIALVGIFDAGRLWPDPYGVRYGIGGGLRFSLVNVNFTLGIAANPQPRRELGQGAATLFLQLSYTDLFR